MSGPPPPNNAGPSRNTPATINDLAPEVREMVAGNLVQEDLATLAAVSLQWRDASERTAFRHLEIPSEEWDVLIANLNHCPLRNGYLRHLGLNLKIDYPLEFPGGRRTPGHMLADILTDPDMCPEVSLTVDLVREPFRGHDSLFPAPKPEEHLSYTVPDQGHEAYTYANMELMAVSKKLPLFPRVPKFEFNTELRQLSGLTAILLTTCFPKAKDVRWLFRSPNCYTLEGIHYGAGNMLPAFFSPNWQCALRGQFSRVLKQFRFQEETKSFTFHMEPAGNTFAEPEPQERLTDYFHARGLGPNADDPFCVALHTAIQNSHLRQFSYKGVVHPSLFWPSSLDGGDDGGEPEEGPDGEQDWHSYLGKKAAEKDGSVAATAATAAASRGEPTANEEPGELRTIWPTIEELDIRFFSYGDPQGRWYFVRPGERENDLSSVAATPPIEQPYHLRHEDAQISEFQAWTDRQFELQEMQNAGEPLPLQARRRQTRQSPCHPVLAPVIETFIKAISAMPSLRKAEMFVDVPIEYTTDRQGASSSGNRFGVAYAVPGEVFGFEDFLPARDRGDPARPRVYLFLGDYMYTEEFLKLAQEISRLRYDQPSIVRMLPLRPVGWPDEGTTWFMTDAQRRAAAAAAAAFAAASTADDAEGNEDGDGDGW